MLKQSVLRGAAVLFAVQCLWAVPASANELSYSNLALGYELREQDGANVRGSTFELQFAVSQDLYITARRSDLEEESAIGGGVDDEWEDLGLGVGFHVPFTETFDFYGEVEYRERDTETNGVSDSEDGFGVGIGLRQKLGKYFEYDTGVTVLSLKEQSTSEYHIGVRGFIRPAISLGARATSSSRATGLYNLELRFDF